MSGSSTTRTTRHAKTPCPYCAYVVDSATSMQDPRARAEPGSVTVCIRCGGLSEYAEDMSLHAFDMGKLDPRDAAVVKRLQTQITERNARDVKRVR